MCRNIKTLFNFDPPVTAEEIRAASVQFVRKISGFSKPSKANEGAFQVAVDEIARISTQLLAALETNAPPRIDKRRRQRRRLVPRNDLVLEFNSQRPNNGQYRAEKGAQPGLRCPWMRYMYSIDPRPILPVVSRPRRAVLTAM